MQYYLFRWRFVIHGAIDGYSRMIVYLQCNANNCAATVLTLFQMSIQTWYAAITSQVG